MNDLRGRAPDRQVRRGIAVVLSALLVPPGTLLLLLRMVPALDLVLRSAVGHLLVVSAISACALAVAVAAAAAAGRSGDGSLVLLALGCLGVGFLMLAHGLVTPGIGERPVNPWVGRLPVLAIAAFAACLAAVHWRRWRLGLDRMQLALVVACLLSAGALLSLEIGRPWHLVWWDYHAFLLAGFAAAIYAVLTGHRRSRTLAEGAYLHDVGKVGIPDHVLNKPGALSDDERAWIQEHPIVGADIVGRAPSLRDALTVIRQHHERYDGRGYSDGLAGEEISLAARIVAVADVWDALTSDRAYRPAWPPDRALRHLEGERGAHFDPRCLDAFLALMAERGHRADQTASADASCH